MNVGELPTDITSHNQRHLMLLTGRDVVEDFLEAFVGLCGGVEMMRAHRDGVTAHTHQHHGERAWAIDSE